MPIHKVFYSWQSDLPNTTNRGFIEKALENAAKSIRADDSIKVEPVIDRDTAGVPGSPDIAKTIFDKIEQSHVFVCDVSIINRGSKFRKAPNPNVLLELGYAIKTLGEQRILMVMNSAFGPPELLPFDLNKKRVISYCMSEQCQERAPERKTLQSKLETALRQILADIEKHPPVKTPPASSIAQQAKAAVENASPNQVVLIRQFMDWLFHEIGMLAPDFSKVEEADELLVKAIEQSKGLVIDFARLAQSIAVMNASNVAITVYRAFNKILKHYFVPPGFSGVIPENDFDFYKFVGHELFVTFISSLILENRWELIADILEEEIYIENRQRGQGGMVSFLYISKHVRLLGRRNERLRLNRISIHADILKERHSAGALGELVPMQQFMCADYFLFMRAEFDRPDLHTTATWNAWSTVFLTTAPPYLEHATNNKYAQQLLRPLGIDTIETFRRKLVELKASERLARIFGDPFWLGLDNPIENFNPQKIGTR